MGTHTVPSSDHAIPCAPTARGTSRHGSTWVHSGMLWDGMGAHGIPSLSIKYSCHPVQMGSDMGCSMGVHGCCLGLVLSCM